MLILDHPYISDFLKETSFKLGLPVLGNQAAREFGLDEKEVLFGEKDFVNRIKEAKEPLVYCNSENPIQWIADNLSFTGLPDKIEAFKDKYRFRGLLRTMYPDFFYRQVEYNELEELEIEEIPLPFIIKPSVGFFSIGVYKVNESSEWSNVVEQIHREVETMPSRFPAEVINTGKFIIEQCIEGEEFAVDAYFDREGRPVILNILKHLFSSGEDVSDRVY
ncbi:MAG: ATP-grasp domain-containing protein, partial [Spirochaetales bacterium]|nr:ATP-grasp domain-containing protein [Spirochaetales bacterium]MCF7937266.1 ATP-grasp domain-containing protein [Spirochaetales bacterium]